MGLPGSREVDPERAGRAVGRPVEDGAQLDPAALERGLDRLGGDGHREQDERS